MQLWDLVHCLLLLTLQALDIPQNFLNNKVGTANSKRDPNYLQYFSLKKMFFFCFFLRQA